MTKSNVVSGKNQSFYKSYFSMTLVIALQNLVVYSVSLADNVMLGGYSELALSGVALCNQIQYFLQMTVMGIGAAMVVLASQFWGRIPSLFRKSSRSAFGWLWRSVCFCGAPPFSFRTGAWAF